MSGTNLAARGDVRGPYQVGSAGAGYIDGYFAEVPASWRAALGGPIVNGQCCLPIVTRTSYGPALFAINPADIGVRNPAPAIPLVYYPSDHFVNDWNVKSTFWNGSTEIGGVVIPENTRSALFFGRQGLGPFCYGEGRGVWRPDRSLQGNPCLSVFLLRLGVRPGRSGGGQGRTKTAMGRSSLRGLVPHSTVRDRQRAPERRDLRQVDGADFRHAGVRRRVATPGACLHDQSGPKPVATSPRECARRAMRKSRAITHPRAIS